MKLLLNIIWVVFSGFWLAVGYSIAGVIAAVLIITIPFVVPAFRIAGFVIWPFGRTVVVDPDRSKGLSGLGNVVWFIVAGWWLALAHIFTAAVLAVTIIGLPLAAGNIKILRITVAPYGKRVVRITDPSEALIPTPA